MTKPTHRDKRTGAAVFPEGYAPADLEPLPSEFWTEQAMVELRHERDRKLVESGEYMWPDRPMTGQQRQAWVNYRQALRDLPATVDPFNFQWPTPPKG